jgi:hypothetical protein
MANRDGWPLWAVSRCECVNCGEYGYSPKNVPPPNTRKYDQWVEEFWPDARTQLTRRGFFVWHNGVCERTWKATHLVAPNKRDGWSHQHQIRMDEKLIHSGVV